MRYYQFSETFAKAEKKKQMKKQFLQQLYIDPIAQNSAA